MLDIKLIRQNLSEVEKALSTRGESINLESFKNFDAEHRLILVEAEELRHRRNVVSDQIASLRQKGEDASSIVVEMREVSTRIKQLERSLSQIEEDINTIVLGLPNIPHPTVPLGKDSSFNSLVRRFGDCPEFEFAPSHTGLWGKTWESSILKELLKLPEQDFHSISEPAQGWKGL